MRRQSQTYCMSVPKQQKTTVIASGLPIELLRIQLLRIAVRWAGYPQLLYGHMASAGNAQTCLNGYNQLTVLEIKTRR